MIKLLILGHKGMLGNAVFTYFSQYQEKYELIVLSERWGDSAFNEKLLSIETDFIINCVGAIPQKYSKQPEKYRELNINLPIFLESLNKKIIHPSTDCEFSGNLPIEEKYKKTSIRDAEDEYGKSKSYISEKIEKEFTNTKIIRTSIIGHETTENKVSLLDWALSSNGTVKGYTDHYWNGITTLQWCKLCESLMNNWDKKPRLNQYGTNKVLNKCDLLKIIFDIYGIDKKVEPYNTDQNINKCLESDENILSIGEQLRELKKFYNK